MTLRFHKTFSRQLKCHTVLVQLIDKVRTHLGLYRESVGYEWWCTPQGGRCSKRLDNKMSSETKRLRSRSGNPFDVSFWDPSPDIQKMACWNHRGTCCVGITICPVDYNFNPLIRDCIQINDLKISIWTILVPDVYFGGTYIWNIFCNNCAGTPYFKLTACLV